jgi:hypothetical protein
VHVDDALHRVGIGELDVVEEAAAQKGVGQFFLVVAGDEHHRPVLGLDQLARLVDIELHAVQLAQQVVREFDVGLVDLVDQQRHRLVAGEGLPQHALDDVVADVAHLLHAFVVGQLAVAQAAHGVVLVQALLGLGGALDMPLQQRQAEGGRHFLGQHGLAGAGLALHQQGPLERDGGIDGQHQVLRGDVVVRSLELHGGVRPAGPCRGWKGNGRSGPGGVSPV